MPFSNPIAGGTALARNAINSPNFQTGVRGWSINRDGSAEFNSALIRGELDVGPATPNPRVAISPNIPAVLSGWNINVIFNVVFLWYYNATDFYWQGIGTFFGTKVYMEGTYDTTNGPYVLRRVLQPGAANIETRLGSYLLNSFTDILKTQQTSLLIGDGSNIGDSLVVNGTAVSNAIAFNSNGNGTPEVWTGGGLGNGWTNRPGAFAPFSYRRVAAPANSIQIVGEIVPGTLTDGTVIANLPAGYRPLHPQLFSGRLGTASRICAFVLGTNGDIQIFDAAGTGTTLVQIYGGQPLPLDV